MAKEDPFDTPEFRAYAQLARDTLEPMVRDAAASISLVPPGNGVDPKFAMELGYMIMLDKPIIAVVDPGSKPPPKLVLVADEIVEGHLDDPDFSERMQAAIDRVVERLQK